MASLLPRHLLLHHRQSARVSSSGVCSTSSARPPLPLRQQCRRQRQCCRAEMDPMESLSRSAVFQSEVVRNEFTKLISELGSLREISKKFPEFDLEGKRLYLDQMELLCERYEVFVKRLELSSDPGAKEYLRGTNAQMLEAGFSLKMMFDGMKQTIEMYRKAVAAEEQAIADPVLHQKFRQELRAAWHGSGMNFMDVSGIDASKVHRAQKDPLFWKAIKEIKDNPSRMGYWAQDPNIGPLVKDMMEQFMKEKMG